MSRRQESARPPPTLREAEVRLPAPTRDPRRPASTSMRPSRPTDASCSNLPSLHRYCRVLTEVETIEQAVDPGLVLSDDALILSLLAMRRRMTNGDHFNGRKFFNPSGPALQPFTA